MVEVYRVLCAPSPTLVECLALEQYYWNRREIRYYISTSLSASRFGPRLDSIDVRPARFTYQVVELVP